MLDLSKIGRCEVQPKRNSIHSSVSLSLLSNIRPDSRGHIAQVGFAVAQVTDSPTIEVQIVARKAEDGRIEFGLRHGGTDPLFPRARYFPTNVNHHDWLTSSPIHIPVAVSGESPKLIHTITGSGNREIKSDPILGGRWEVTYLVRTCSVRLTGALEGGYTAVIPGRTHQEVLTSRGGIVTATARSCSGSWTVALRWIGA